MDYSLPGSSVHGIFQARVLEWAAISFSRESLPPRDWTQTSYVFCISIGRQVLYTGATWEAQIVAGTQQIQVLVLGEFLEFFFFFNVLIHSWLNPEMQNQQIRGQQ